jgi:S1-C subfamily serine protease
MSARMSKGLALTVAIMAIACGCTAEQGGGTPAGTATPATPPTTDSTTANEVGPPATGDLFARIPDIVQRVEPSVVTIFTAGGVGSGVVYDDKGSIVTNAHVVGDATQVQVGLASGARIPGRVLAADTVTDLAVADVERDGLRPAEFEPTLPRLGELVLAIGSPLGFENSVSAGIVSGVGREIPLAESRALVDLIQTDAAISPGNSGGALVNAGGKVVGINEAYIPPQEGAVSLGFAIPAATAVDVARQLLESGEAVHPFIGISPGRLTPEIAQALGLGTAEGVLVREVVPNSPAAAAGLRPGDVITSVQGPVVRTVEDFFGELRKVEPGDKVTLTVQRDGQTETLTVTAGRLQ